MDNKGYLTTKDGKGSGVVTLTDRDNPQNIRVMSILVTEIHSLVVEGSQKAALLSKGSHVTLKVTFQDEQGMVFPSPLLNKKVVVSNTNPSIVSTSLDNGTSELTLRGIEGG